METKEGLFGEARQWVTAAQAFENALKVNPRDAAATSSLAVALLHLGRLAEAEAKARDAVALDSSRASHWANLGACLFGQQRWAEAAAAFREAVRREAENAALWANWGEAEQRLGALAEAQAAFERSLAIDPQQVPARIGLASVIAQRGRPTEASELLRPVLEQFPQHAPAWVAAGNAFSLAGNLGEAIAALRKAKELVPERFEVNFNLARVLLDDWKLDEAEVLVRDLVRKFPDSAEAWSLLGRVLQQQTRLEPATDAFRKAGAIQVEPVGQSRILSQMQYQDDVDPVALLAAHRQWSDQFAKPMLPHVSNPSRGKKIAGRPLRLGFVSADFGTHPVGFFTLPILERLDRSRCSLSFYSDRMQADGMTGRFRAVADTWRDTVGVSDEEVADWVRADDIDVLFDLMGHTGRRLLLFARKPAPIQVAWLGYAGTTGLSAIDFLLADRFHVREGEEENYAEKILRMPHDYVCYGPPDNAPAVGPLPAKSRGYVTFGCFNNPLKYGNACLALWSRVLKAIPGSRLLLKFGGLDQNSAQERLVARFAANGIARERLLMEGGVAHGELLASYHRVDLALDTLPYSGGLTTCEALWMGVPVLTMPGETLAGRHSTSHLMNAGLGQFVARDADHFVESATGWAQRLDELADLRSEMREMVRRSPLCDAEQCAADFCRLLLEQAAQ